MTTTPISPGWPPEWPSPPGPPPAPGAPRPPLPEWTTPAGFGNDWLLERLFENRVVLIHGIVDRSAATCVVAQLRALDTAAQRPVTLQIDSPSADLTAALLVADALDLMRVSTHGLIVGEAGGATLAILMATDHRTAYRHARLRLSEPPAEIPTLFGDPREAAKYHAALLSDFVERLAVRTRRPAGQIAADLRSRRYLSSSEAVEYGLIDAVAEPDAPRRSRP